MRGIEGALARYRILAYIVGTGLLILVFIGTPLTFFAHVSIVAKIVGPIHGFLYIVYLLAAVDLARRARFTLLQMAAMIGAGFLPFLAFFIEHRVSKRVAMLLADRAQDPLGVEAQGNDSVISGGEHESDGHDAQPGDEVPATRTPR